MKKRFTAITLCAAMAFSMLTGCGNNARVLPDEPEPISDTIISDTDVNNNTNPKQIIDDNKTQKVSADDSVVSALNDNEFDFIVNTEYEFNDDYSLQNITEILDYVDRENNDPIGNTILSETSLNMALSLLLEGANDDTDSYNALIQYLSSANYPNTLLGIRARNNALISRYMFSDDTTPLSIANSTWFNYGTTPTDYYRTILSQYYYGRTQSLDFTDPASADIINSWCEGATDGKIPFIITPETLAMNDGVLINSIYFLSNWETEFTENNCRDAVFTNADGSTSNVTMMYEYGLDAYYESNWCEAFMKPYANSNMVFVGILPKADTDFSVSELDLDDMLSNAVYGYDVNIGIPQFRIEDENHIFNALYNNGLAPAFRAGNNDYTNCLCDTPVSVSDVIQKTFIDVNPTGTEAAAVTAITLEKSVMPVRNTEVHEIILDRPFVFMIYDTETHECLFIGKINSL